MHHNNTETVSKKSTLKKIKEAFLIFTGIVFTGLGIIGIFLPLLPTTVFFLLAAVSFSHSSKMFYDWLLNNKWFGSYIRNYREKKGISMKVKVFTVLLLWVTILSSVIFAVDNIYVKAGLLIIAVAVTIHIVTLPTLRENI